MSNKKKSNIKLLNIFSFFIVISLICFYKCYENKNVNMKSIDDTLQYSSSQFVQANINNIWCGSFQLVWNDLKEYINGNVEFDNMRDIDPNVIDMLNTLNNNKFTKDMINDDNYYIKFAKATASNKIEIYNDIYDKFGFKTNFLDDVDTMNSNEKIMYSCIYKEFKFLNEFENKIAVFSDNKNNTSKVQAFGISYKSKNENIIKNIDTLYYNNYYNYAIKIYTKENDEIILCKSENLEKFSLDELYQEVLYNEKNGKNNIEFKIGDSLTIPDIKLLCSINYDELCGANKILKGTDGEYITLAIQDINFELSREGGKIKSEATVSSGAMSSPPLSSVEYSFNEPFVLFIKEKEKNLPYFAMKILDNTFLKIIN